MGAVIIPQRFRSLSIHIEKVIFATKAGFFSRVIVRLVIDTDSGFPALQWLDNAAPEYGADVGGNGALCRYFRISKEWVGYHMLMQL